MNKIQAKDLKKGDRFTFKLDFRKRIVYIVNDCKKHVEYYDSSDKKIHKTIKTIKDLKTDIYLLKRN
jgi:hypothetical protein